MRGLDSLNVPSSNRKLSRQATISTSLGTLVISAAVSYSAPVSYQPQCHISPSWFHHGIEAYAAATLATFITML